ncbi:hypothetical protein ACB098_12G125300 [Castanea mollissima]
MAGPSSIVMLTVKRQRTRWVFTPLALSLSSSSTSPSRKLILYSKPGCCLCDGLKEKLQAAFLISGPDSLHDVDLQIRDITSNPEWERAYQYEIPVLAKVRSDGTETKKRKKIQIQTFYLMSMMHFKKPRLFLLQHSKT